MQIDIIVKKNSNQIWYCLQKMSLILYLYLEVVTYHDYQILICILDFVHCLLENDFLIPDNDYYRQLVKDTVFPYLDNLVLYLGIYYHMGIGYQKVDVQEEFDLMDIYLLLDNDLLVFLHHLPHDQVDTDPVYQNLYQDI